MKQINIKVTREEAEYIINCLADEIQFHTKVLSTSTVKAHSKMMEVKLSNLRDRIVNLVEDVPKV